MIGADDFAVFFDPEEFGEVVELDGVAGLAAVWESSTSELPVGDTAMTVDVNLFRFPATQALAPVTGGTVLVPRLGLSFRLVGEPRLIAYGSEWVCEAEPQ